MKLIQVHHNLVDTLETQLLNNLEHTIIKPFCQMYQLDFRSGMATFELYLSKLVYDVNAWDYDTSITYEEMASLRQDWLTDTELFISDGKRYENHQLFFLFSNEQFLKDLKQLEDEVLYTENPYRMHTSLGDVMNDYTYNDNLGFEGFVIVWDFTQT